VTFWSWWDKHPFLAPLLMLWCSAIVERALSVLEKFAK
jgi:hypothetical protein